jgi:hypothetical protein
VEAVRTATPEALSLMVARVVVPTAKVTVPVGLPVAPEAERLTVAVRVTLAGGVTVVGEAARAVEVGALLRVTVRGLDAEEL